MRRHCPFKIIMSTCVAILLQAGCGGAQSSQPNARKQVKNIIGTDDLAPVNQNAPEDVKTLSRKIVRIHSGGEYCTGFLIADDAVMTASHCLSPCKDMQIEFFYNGIGEASKLVACRDVYDGPSLMDFAVIFLKDKTDVQPLTIRGYGIFGEDPLYMLAHPGGKLLQLDASDDCHILGVGGPSETQLYHGCDTLSGSSGAPLLQRNSGHVIGLHHRSGSVNNIAVPILTILEDLKESRPDIYGNLKLSEI